MWRDSSEANRGVPLLRLARVDILWRASEPGVLERLRPGHDIHQVGPHDDADPNLSDEDRRKFLSAEKDRQVHVHTHIRIHAHTHTCIHAHRNASTYR